jgi:hypothetical protein
LAWCLLEVEAGGDVGLGEVYCTSVDEVIDDILLRAVARAVIGQVEALVAAVHDELLLSGDGKGLICVRAWTASSFGFEQSVLGER